jgi:uncharacterized protein YcfJ
MKLPTTLATVLPIALLATGTAALAQQPRYPPARHSDATSFGYATVLRVTPVWEIYRTTQLEQRCLDGEGYYGPDNRDKTTAGTVISAVVGGALGNTVGKGDGRRAATVAGALAGGAIGHHVASTNPNYYGPPCRMVDVQARRAVGFDVEYSYKGDIYFTRMSYDPGNRLRVRVTVVPDDRVGPSVGY